MGRGNLDNLIPNEQRTPEERRRNAIKAGKASGKKRRQLRDWKEVASTVLSLPLKEGDVDKQVKSIADAKGKNIDAQTAVMIGQVVRAIKGDAKAAEFVFTLTNDINPKDNELVHIPDDTPLIIPAFDALNGDIKRHNHTHYWLKGGRGSTKSSFISLKIPLLLMSNEGIHAVVARKVANTLKNSVYAQMEWAINELGLYDAFEFKKSPLEIVYKRTGQKIIFLGVDDKGKIKSLKVPFGYVGCVWYEELDQFAGMAEIRNINQSLLRGGDKYWCFYSFNPPRSKDNWVNIEQLHDEEDRMIVHSNYTQVPRTWLGEQFILEAEKLRELRPDLYAHEYMGTVTGTGGDVFPNVEERTITDDDIATFSNIRHGLDFGFAVDPVAYVKLHYDRKYDALYIYDEVYGVRMTNKDIYNRIKDKVGDGHVSADSVEPKSIAEIREFGMSIAGVPKGAGSRNFWIKWLSDRAKIYIDKKRCPNAYREFTSYEFEQDKDGSYISAYPDKNNHTIDATMYACYDGTIKAAKSNLY